jgi:hypothetical protein
MKILVRLIFANALVAALWLLVTLPTGAAEPASLRNVDRGDRRALTPVYHKSFQGAEATLHPWQGKHIVFLTDRSDLDPKTMATITGTSDRIYEFYATMTGREPEVGADTTIGGRGTIAVIKDTCGSGCGRLGATGIEIIPDQFEELYRVVEESGEFTHLLPYEFGRNFWFYGSQIEYRESENSRSGCVSTGYAVFMRFMSMDATGTKGSPFKGGAFEDFEQAVVGLVDRYIGDTSLNWSNTLRVYKAPENAFGLNGTDLFASFVFRLRRDYGGDNFVARLWLEVARRPAAESTQDAIDNFVVAASLAARTDLTSLFRQQWRWPVSDEAAMEIMTGSRQIKKRNPMREKFVHSGGYFEREGTGTRQWKEHVTSKGEFFFEEVVRDEQAIFIRDARRGFTIRIPMNGGESRISSDSGATWSKLYELKKE